MKDFLGNTVQVRDIVLYGNNSGFITLAIVTEIAEDKLHVVKRGYRGSTVEKDLLIPNNVLVVTDDVLATSPEVAASPEEVEFVRTRWAMNQAE